MGRIILEFDTAEEWQDARLAMDGWKWQKAMWDLDQKLRGVTKYGASLANLSQEATKKEIEIADKIRDEIREILNGYSLNLED
jgi:hypothetical protein